MRGFGSSRNLTERAIIVKLPVAPHLTNDESTEKSNVTQQAFVQDTAVYQILESFSALVEDIHHILHIQDVFTNQRRPLAEFYGGFLFCGSTPSLWLIYANCGCHFF